MPRCQWCLGHDEYVAYHDDEWGRPVVDDVRLYEKVCLEGFQSGLSWLTILRKRPAFRTAFAGFDPEQVARFGDDDVARLLDDAGIVRHRGKIEATINNARATLDVQEAEGSLAALVWSFEPDRAARPAPTRLGEVASTTPESTALAKELKKPRLPVRGPDHGVRRHAVPRPGRRPLRGVPRPPGLRTRPRRDHGAHPPHLTDPKLVTRARSEGGFGHQLRG